MRGVWPAIGAVIRTREDDNEWPPATRPNLLFDAVTWHAIVPVELGARVDRSETMSSFCDDNALARSGESSPTLPPAAGFSGGRIHTRLDCIV